jgi:hypothetical protein
MKHNNILPLLIFASAIGAAGCINKTDSNKNPDSASNQNPAQTNPAPNQSTSTTEPSKQESSVSSAGNLARIAGAFEQSKQESSASVIEIKETQSPERKEFLDEDGFTKLLDDAQYNIIYFKFNRDELKKPNNLKYWVALNSCEKVSKINNEFEWPGILEEYTKAIDPILDKIPVTLNVMVKGYFGQYDLTKKSFPVLAKVDKQEQLKIDKIGLGAKNQSVCDSYVQMNQLNNYILDLSKEISVPQIEMNEEAAKDFVTKHPNPYSREVIISIDSDVTGTVGPGQRREVIFNATPKKMKILDGRNRDIVIHEFNFQVAK